MVMRDVEAANDRIYIPLTYIYDYETYEQIRLITQQQRCGIWAVRAILTYELLHLKGLPLMSRA